jgi:Organic radical activating enzymes
VSIRNDMSGATPGVTRSATPGAIPSATPGSTTGVTRNVTPIVTYRVNDLYSTIQGEGQLTGTPMILLRLQGCPVGCTFCDTKETWAMGDAALSQRRATLGEARGTNALWAELDTEALVQAVCDERANNAPGVEWVLLTGGEPAEQPVRPLIGALHRRGFKVALETSGTARGHLDEAPTRLEDPTDSGDSSGDPCDFVCCSPKIDNPGGRPIISEVVRGADEIKMVIGKASDIEAFEVFIKEHDLTDMTKLSLQPMSQSHKATELCTATALRLGCRVSIQTHKVIGVR